MRRKIIRQGNNSYTLTLPIRWIDEHRLKPGEEIEIVPEGDALRLQPVTGRDVPESTVEIDLQAFRGETVRGILNQLYRHGFDRIQLLVKDEAQRKIVRQTTKETMLGFQLIEETERRIVVQNIAEPSEEKLDVILRRLFLTIAHEGERILAQLQAGKLNGPERAETRLLVDNYTNYIRRTIIRRHVGGPRGSYVLYYMASLLSLIAHSHYYLARYIEQEKLVVKDADILDLHEEVLALFRLVYENHYRNDFEKIDAINRRKAELQERIFGLLERKRGKLPVVLHYLMEQVRLMQLAVTPHYGLRVLDEER